MTKPDSLGEKIIFALFTIAFAGYPFFIYFGLTHFEPWILYTGIGIVLIGRGVISFRSLEFRHFRKLIPPGIAIFLLVLGGAILNNETFILLLPGLMSAVGAVFFLRSLYVPPSLIETFARMSISDLSEEDVRYCRNVTLLWSLFFILNTAIVFVLTFTASLDTWTLYTGFIAYLLMGSLFLGEFLYRTWKFRRYRGYWFDPMLRWLFPPRGNVAPTYIRLHRMIIQGRRAGYPVARGEDHVYSWKRFRRKVAGVTQKLEKIIEAEQEDNPDSNRWVLCCENTFHFCVGLLAIWQVEGVAVLPPNPQEGQLKELVGENIHGALLDDGVKLSETTFPVINPAKYEAEGGNFQLVNRERTAVELFTSGSTGDRKCVQKTLVNLEEEIFGLEERWGDRLGDADVFATVSHQHIYGLLFRALWPLSAGRAFDEYSHLYPGELEDHVTKLSEKEAVLVSSPAHLKRLVQYEYESFSSFVDLVRTVFSSGAPLPRETAEEVNDMLGHFPIEVLGSTETGGVAWRTRKDGNDLWTTFEPVEIEDRGTLHVRSPFVSKGEGEWCDMGDRVEIKEEGFLLGDRADRIVNIAGKRLSLPELEHRLNEHEYVDRSAVLSIKRESNETERKILGSAVVLSGDGEKKIEKEGKQQMNRTLRLHLLPYFEAVTVPKFWRYLDELPRDAQGKTSTDKLKELFEKSHHREMR